MPKLAPMNPAVLAWAIDAAGIDAGGLASKAKVPKDRIQDFLNGDSLPTTSEFRSIASELGRPLAFFFLPEPPQSSSVIASFRAGKPAQHAEVRPEEREALRTALRWQRVTTWIRERSDALGRESAPLVPRTTSPATAASEIATWLAWSNREQQNATSASAVLRIVRGALERHGFLVLQFSMGKDACRGFLLPDGPSPVIGLNTSYNAEARVFTVFHELAHLVRGDSAICDDPWSSEIERWCEQTAASVLIPAADLLAYLDRWVTRGKVSSLAEVRRVARRYRVSIRAAAVRVIQLGRAVPGLYDRIDRETDFEGGGPNPNAERQTTSVIRIRSLGLEVPRQLLRARDEGLLSDAQVRRYLSVNPQQLDEIAGRVRMADAEA